MALRRRHPGDNVGPMVGQWTCIEEWLGIDLLALNAWRKADVIGYEVKVSRSDLRRELLRPDKRTDAVARTTEFYFAVPAGLLTAEEKAFEEPVWEKGDFERARCPGVPEFGPPVRRFGREKRYGGPCHGRRGRDWRRARQPFTVPMPVPRVLTVFRSAHDDDAAYLRRVISELRHDEGERVPCPACGGKGYQAKSRVEREAPTLWIPRDVGLVEVSGRGVSVVRPSPKRKDPKPIATSRQTINDLVRWVSHRPDPRHRA